MCGLIGMAIKAQNGFATTEKDCFDDLLFIDMLRGMDSTGITAVYNTGDVEILKVATDAYTLKWYKDYGADEYDKVMSALFSRGKAVLGHNRKSTVGKTTDANAHPFVINDKEGNARYFFMHNGTLRNHKSLGGNFDVDSEALGNVLCDTNGDKEKLEEVLAKVEGAYACQWVDQEENKVYLLRNKERPLYLANTSAGWIWASEMGFIVAAAARQRIKIEDIQEVKDHTLVSISLDGYSLTKEETELSVKKPTPQASTKANTGPTKSGATNNCPFRPKGKISKNQFRKLKRNLLGTTLSFWMDDYVERHYPTRDTEWLVWGSNESMFPIPHRIVGHLNGVPYEELKYHYDGNLLTAKVVDCEYNDNDPEIIIKIEQPAILMH